MPQQTLKDFLAAYFHQDWAMEHGSVEDVVDYYKGAESREQVAALRADVAGLRAEGLDETALSDRLRDYGSEYAPSPGGSYRAFVDAIAARLG